MTRFSIVIATIADMMMLVFACTCPEVIKCTNDNCFIKRTRSRANYPETDYFELCHDNCLNIAGCSTFEDLDYACLRCDVGFYTDINDSKTCVPHTSCPPGQGVKVQGSSVTDTVCEKCETGRAYSSTNSSTEQCLPCSQCDSDDTAVRECSPISDTICKNDKGATTISLHDELRQEIGLEEKYTTLIVVISNVGGVCLIIIFSAILVVLHRKGKLKCLRRPHSADTESILPSTCDEIGIEESRNAPNAPASAAVSTTQTGTVNQIEMEQTVEVLYERIGLESHVECSGHSGSSSRTIKNLSDSEIPKSRSLPLSRACRGEDNRFSRNSRSSSKNLKISKVRSRGQGKPVYSFHRALTDLSYHLCGIEWEMFFRRLIGEGSDEILGRVKRDYARSVREQIYHMLLEWKKIRASEATLNVLIKELEDMDENLLASVYRQKLPNIVYP